MKKYEYRDKIYTEEELIEVVLEELKDNFNTAQGRNFINDAQRELNYYIENDHLIKKDFAYEV